MKPYFLFPSAPLNKKRIDEAFQDQAKTLTDAGYGHGIVNLEDDSIFSPRGGTLPQTPFKQEKVIYRGWMLNEHEYNQQRSWLEAGNYERDYGRRAARDPRTPASKA